MSSGARSVRRRVVQALVESCGGAEGTVVLGSSDMPELVGAARFHRIAPLVLVAFRHTGDPGLQPLQLDRLAAVTTHLRACAVLDELALLLHDVEWVTFKGPVLSERSHPLPGLRTYNDVDVLVAPSSLREVCRRLRAAGWQLADFADMLVADDPPGEMHWVSPGGVLVDMHWAMINMHSRRRLFDVSTAALLGRRVPVSHGPGEPWWTLDPVDSLLHVCLHAALAGANKLVYLVDVDRLSRAVADWAEVTDRARQWGAQSQVALVLGRARRVLGTPVPAGLDARLAVPPPVRWLMTVTDRLAPVPRGRHDAGAARLVARAVRATTSETASATLSHVVRGTKERMWHPSADARDRRPATPESLEVFLGAVEASVRPGV